MNLEFVYIDVRRNATDCELAMAEIRFERIFKSQDSNRDKFLSRLFGIFSEEIVRIWCKNPQSPYENLGRPTLRQPGEARGRTLDFTFRSRQNSRVFVGELKCELEYKNYQFLTLTSRSQLNHHTGEAFKRFLEMAQNPRKYTVIVNGKNVCSSGAILVWGSVADEGRKDVMNSTGLADVLSLEQIITDLIKRADKTYYDFIEPRAMWCQDLFSALRL